MCLTIMPTFNRESAIQKIFGNKGRIVVWKVYRKSQKNKLYPIYCHKRTEINAGWIVSNRKDIRLGNKFTISKGIHVFLNIEEAQDYRSYNEIVVPVYCYKKDFVAAHIDEKEAVFIKVFLKKEDYTKAIRGCSL